MHRIFMGYDPREAVGFHACIQSIISKASKPVEIIPVFGNQRDGTNAFTYARFLVPYMCDYKGSAVFLDGADMLVREDIIPLFGYASDVTKAVSVVKQEYTTRQRMKYVGTPMETKNEDYPRKNWSSVMVFNCAHARHRALHPDTVDSMTGASLHRFNWCKSDEIGELHSKWNVLIGEGGEDKPCAIAHFTLGIPAFPNYADCLYADEWFVAAKSAMYPMGHSL